MYEPTFKEYYNLLSSIFSDIILKHKHVAVTAFISAILVFVSTYYITELAEASAVLLDRSHSSPFDLRLYNCAKISFFALTLRCVPLAYFTYLIQHIARIKFVEVLRSYMLLPYYKFHKKTPGEIRFTVFLKSLSYPICTQIVVFDFTSLIGSTLFTFIKAYNDISLYPAVVFSMFPLLYLLYMIFFLKYRLIYRTLNLVEQEKTSSRIYDKLSNFDVIKAYNLENLQIDSLRNSIKGQIETQMTTDVFTAKGKYFGRFLIILPYILLAIFSLAKPNSISGSLLFQATLLYSSLSIQIKKMGAQLVKLSSFLNQIGYDKIDAEILSNSQTAIESFNHKIEFLNVDLFHEDKIILHSLSFTIYKNDRIAIVGKNGTGKSTLIKAMLGFTKYNGDILIDGINIKNLTNKSIFSLISYISQDDYTSDDTIMNNIKLGNKTVSDQYVYDKSRLIETHEMITGLEHGYETQAGIKGTSLSGGQRQKLSLLRAIVKDGPIFIFDEATAAIDKEYEKKIINILMNTMKNKTIVMIIHEKSYLEDFDKIFYLNNETVEEIGTYNDLMKNNYNFQTFIRNK